MLLNNRVGLLMNPATLVLSCGILMILMQCSLGAQSHAMNGAIEGIIRTENGTGVGGVTVGLKNQDGGLLRQFRTNNTGRYRAPLLPLGNYELQAEREGYL